MVMINVMKTKDKEAAKRLFALILVVISFIIIIVISTINVSFTNQCERYGDACFSFFPTIGTQIFFLGEARSSLFLLNDKLWHKKLIY